MSYRKDSNILIVGAGVFGLSNALHLAQNGYKNITVFDRLDMLANHYTFLEGADTASADINKIFRAEYADEKHYQDLAFKAFEIWEKWDREISFLPLEEIKNYTELKILDLCGMLNLDDTIGWEEQASRDNYAKEGLSELRLDVSNPADVKRAEASGFRSKIKFVEDWKKNVGPIEGSLDLTSGMLYASRACQYVNYLCRMMGVKFILGGEKGTFQEFICSGRNASEVSGIITMDGKRHHADLVVVCCGPWSTQIIPELDGINEATSGSILIFKIPESRRDLQVKYSAKNFPLMGWKTGHATENDDMAGMMIFPMSEPEGYMKIIARQTKYTNPVKLEDGRIVSIPKTSNSNPPFTHLTSHIVTQIGRFMNTFFPDLAEANLKFQSKVLWYTDTINNDFIFDYVPGKKGLFVACGGSGHGFKFLPVLGQFLVDKLEGRENFYTKLFSWRYFADFKKDPNGLREGLRSKRAYDCQNISTDKDLKFFKPIL